MSCRIATVFSHLRVRRDEDIAAKSAEISELKERVAELERLKDEQQKLISLKDSELAAAQQRLQEVRTVPPADATPATAHSSIPRYRIVR